MAASAAAVSASAMFAKLPLQRGDDPAVTAGLPVVLQLGLAGALIVGLAVFYKLRQRRAMGRTENSTLHAPQVLRLSQGANLHVVHWGDEELLLASTSSTVAVLSRRTRPVSNSPQGDAA